MGTETEAVALAAELVGYGLQPKLFPGRHQQYRELLERYRRDLDFRYLADGVARGLGLRIASATELGLYLAALPGSPFAFTLASWRRERGVASFEDRLLHGLAVVAIVAYFYPQAVDVEVERHRRATVTQVEGFLRSAAAEVAKRSPDSAEAVLSEHEQACRIYLRQKEVVGTADGRRPQRGTTSVIARAFELLADQGLVRRAGEEGSDPVYQPLERMRLQVADIASNEAYDALARIRREGSTPNVPAKPGPL